MIANNKRSLQAYTPDWVHQHFVRQAAAESKSLSAHLSSVLKDIAIQQGATPPAPEPLTPKKARTLLRQAFQNPALLEKITDILNSGGKLLWAW